jgi:hypothetical protein
MRVNLSAIDSQAQCTEKEDTKCEYDEEKGLSLFGVSMTRTTVARLDEPGPPEGPDLPQFIILISPCPAMRARQGSSNL